MGNKPTKDRPRYRVEIWYGLQWNDPGHGTSESLCEMVEYAKDWYPSGILYRLVRFWEESEQVSQSEIDRI